MNTLQRRSFPVAALGLLVLLAAGPAATSRGQVAAVPVVADQTADQAWSDLATKTYDQRDQLMTGVNRLSARLDDLMTGSNGPGAAQADLRLCRTMRRRSRSVVPPQIPSRSR